MDSQGTNVKAQQYLCIPKMSTFYISDSSLFQI